MIKPDRLTVSVPEAGAMLGISRNTAYRLARAGQLPGVIALGQKRLVVSIQVIERLLQVNDNETEGL